jgi:hypothetical protein
MALPRLARAEVLDALTMPAMCPVIQENIVHEDTGASVARIPASNVANLDLPVVATGPMASCSLSSLADTVMEDEDDVITAEQITVHRPVGIAAPASAGQGSRQLHAQVSRYTNGTQSCNRGLSRCYRGEDENRVASCIDGCCVRCCTPFACAGCKAQKEEESTSARCYR